MTFGIGAGMGFCTGLGTGLGCGFGITGGIGFCVSASPIMEAGLGLGRRPSLCLIMSSASSFGSRYHFQKISVWLLYVTSRGMAKSFILRIRNFITGLSSSSRAIFCWLMSENAVFSFGSSRSEN